MKTKRPPDLIALAAQLFELGDTLPTEIRLVPDGLFRSSRDSRPTDVAAWVMNDDCAAAILSAVDQLQSRFLVDYDHQTLHAAESSEPAPAKAAGWGARLEWRPGDGMYAVDIDWNAAAASAILKKEYRYISPVIRYDRQTGMVTGIPMAALTNYPAIDNLNDLAAAAALLFNPEQDTTMDEELLERLRWFLNLPITATAADVAAELDKLKAQIMAPDGSTVGLAALLKERGEAVAALAAKVDVTPDPTKFVPLAVVTQLRDQLAALSGDTVDMRVAQLIEEGVKDGRIVGDAAKAWLTNMGKKDFAALQGFLGSAQPIAALAGMQTGGKSPAALAGREGLAALSAEELEVCEQLGLSADDFLKQKNGK